MTTARISSRSTVATSVLLSVAGSSLALYLGTSPLFWLPGVSVQIVGALKLFFAAVGVLAVYFNGLVTSTLRFPPGVLGPVGFVSIIILAMPGLTQTELLAAISRLGDFTLSFGFLWCFYNYARAGGDWQKVFKTALLIIAILSAITLTNAIFGVPAWYAPHSLVKVSLATTGFGYKRTGWSNGIGMFVPIAFLFLTVDQTRSGRLGGFARIAVLVAVILGAQVACGGRAGLVASVASVIIYAVRSRLRVHFLILLLTVGLAAYSSSDFLTDKFRLGVLESSNVSVDDINRLSSGRLFGYMVALDLIAEKPFTGHGFEQVTLEQYGAGYREVHNMWLQLWVESGLAFVVGFSVIVLAILRRAMKRYRHNLATGSTTHILTLGLIVVSGLLISMFEPRTLLGSFQNTAIWWAAAGVLLGDRH